MATVWLTYSKSVLTVWELYGKSVPAVWMIYALSRPDITPQLMKALQDTENILKTNFTAVDSSKKTE